MYSSINSLGVFGMNAFAVTVETDVSASSKAATVIVGLPDAAVTESRERVRSAVNNSGYYYPGDKKVTFNLAPADIRKEGPLYDLPMFLGVLGATGQLRADLSSCAFIGELSMSGEVRHVNGVLPMVLEARRLHIQKVFFPAADSAEAGVVDGIELYPVRDVKQLMDHISGAAPIAPLRPVPYVIKRDGTYADDFSDVKGQLQAKRSLEVAAAGGHNVMMIGPPGSGKSMLAKRIPSILPDMTFEEALETTKVFSVAGLLRGGSPLISARPFRSPHHTISAQGLTGGGAVPRPGEVSLAHNGVLFLDELPEFSKVALEALRQPLEDGVVTISRVAGRLTYPCSVMLVAASNPCPCGYFGDSKRKCTCPPGAPAKYMSRISGPLLDRFDIHIEVSSLSYGDLSDRTKGESSAAVRERVNRARLIQMKRFAGTPVTCNAKMTATMTKDFCILTPAAERLISGAFDRLGLSGRAYDKILRVSRTIADLDGADRIDVKHISEAIQYRSLDRKFWNG